MKTKIIEKRSALCTVLIFFLSTLVFNNSCQKEIDANATIKDDTFKTNASIIPQIVYTDINPDKMYLGNFTLPLDLNNDGIVDFNIVGFDYRHCNCGPVACKQGCFNTDITRRISIAPLGLNNEILIDKNSMPLALDSNNIISSSLLWNNTSSQILRYYHHEGSTLINTYTGNWATTEDKFVGLKLVLGNKIFYGWARLAVNVSNVSCIIRDYAFNSVSSQSILAAQTQ